MCGDNEHPEPLAFKKRTGNALIRNLVITIAVMIVLTACNASLTSMSPNTSATPRNLIELCRIVHIDPETEQICHQTEGWRSVLEKAFPPKFATLDEVRKLLDPYRDEGLSKPTIYGTLETYRIAAGLMGPIHAIFGFDKDGVLINIIVED